MQSDVVTQSHTLVQKAALFLQTIKASTAEHHVLLESHPFLAAITSPGVTLRQYCVYLLLMKKITEGYEEAILPQVASIFLQGNERKASALIAADLGHIGYVLPPAPLFTDYTLGNEKRSVPFALGFRYVMEGSKLGGKVIFKHIHRSLGFTERGGATFIADYGVDTMSRWKEFLAAFSSYVVENDGESEAIQGAVYAFTSFYDFLQSNWLVYEI